MSSAAVPPPPAGLGLNEILGILWRRRLLILAGTTLGAVAGFVYGLVVTPLHIASATVQPGITSFNAQAQPVREWQLKDISQWYKRGDYNPHLAVAMGEDPTEFRPIIRATFIPRGPQSRGGFTINLSTLSPSPAEAEQILERSVDVFNAFAGADTSFSNIHLMRVQIAAAIDKQEIKVQQVQGSIERARLGIAAADADVAAENARKGLLTDQINEAQANVDLYDQAIGAHRETMATVESGVSDLESRVAEWEALATKLKDERDRAMESGPARDSLTMMMFANSIGELISDVGTLRLGVFDQAERLLDWQTTVQELNVERQELVASIQELEFERDVTIPRTVMELEQTAKELQIDIDYDLPLEASEATEQLAAMRARLASLTPLEQVGNAVASARPVRPRKQRAVMILTMLALVSSIFASFSLEYLSKNWRSITQGTGSA